MTIGDRPIRPPAIEVVRARGHNLKELSVSIDRAGWTAVVGPSGSGKTTLVFDTLVAEGERRYLGSLSPKARQFFGKLGRAQADAVRGLPVPIAVGRRSITRDPRSTVGTQSGVLDLLRLLFARRASAPVPLTRSHFSFNVPLGACVACRGLGVEDRVDPERLVRDASRSIRAGALVPTQPNGYTVYSQVTVDVLDTVCRAHGFDVDTPWQDLAPEQRDVVLYGTRALKVPFGKHPLESRMKWAGITARPREEGYYRGIVPVIEETLARSRNPGVLRFVRSVACGACEGTRLGEIGRSARLASGASLPDWLRLAPSHLAAALAGEAHSTAADDPVLAQLRPLIERRTSRMTRLGLDHLAFDRGASTLSDGEAQRLRLVAHVTEGLTGALYAFDEPTLGLHPESQAGMRDVLDDLVVSGNTVLVVEHDPDMVESADRVLALGPGAGPAGGELVADLRGPVRALGGAPTPRDVSRAAPDAAAIELVGATLHGLQRASLRIVERTLHVVVGPSGAGKSSLVFGTLLPALEGKTGGDYEALEVGFGGARGPGARAVDARPMGRSSRSTPATWSGAFDAIRRALAGTDEARAQGFKAGHFSFNTNGGRCEACEGLGVQRVGLHLLEDAVTACAACGGRRYDAATLEVRLERGGVGVSVADVLEMTAAEGAAFFADNDAIAPVLRAMVGLGLGYLPLGAPSTRLSSGESQRIRLATMLAAPDTEPTLFVFDEPDRGLHPSDLDRLLAAFDQLIERGHTVLAISHHRHLWAAADQLTEVREGVARSTTFRALEPGAAPARQRTGARALPSHVRLRGVRTHNLRSIDVDLPLGSWTSVVGPSGSGKSSLAFDTVAAESWHRFAESLPFQVRRFTQRAPRPEFDDVSALPPVVALRQTTGSARGLPDRSTLATETDLGPLLRLLFSRAGTIDGAPTSLTAEHFSPDRALGACPACDGRGFELRSDLHRLRIDGSKTLDAGAFAATRAGAFFTEPGGRHLATLRVAAAHPLDVPWDELPPAIQRVALDGTGDAVHSVTWRFERGGRSGEHLFEEPWDGLLALVEREALRRRSRKDHGDEWGAVLAEVPCPACEGARLGPVAAAVRVAGLRLHEALSLPLADLPSALAGDHPAAAALLPEIETRCGDLVDLGLGPLALSRRLRTLSSGELQRARLAAVLRSDLAGVLVVVDEPAHGLDGARASAVARRLRELVERGSTVLAVTHRAELIHAADHIVELGPGAGEGGGSVLFAGPVDAWFDTGSRLSTRLDQSLSLERVPSGAPRLVAGEHHLPASGFVAVTGPSGAGKTRTLFDDLGPALAPRFKSVHQSAQLGGGSLVLTALDALAAMQRRFHSSAKEQGLDLPRAAFSYMSPKGRCPACAGAGSESIAMDIVADVDVPCEACNGRRYRPEVLAVTHRGFDIATLLATPIDGARDALASQPDALAAAATALTRVGLGHLALGRPTASLSGGERQRLALAAGLRQLTDAPRPALFLLDQPDAGLSTLDLPPLAQLFTDLAAEGHLILAAIHNPALIEIASETLRLGAATPD